MFRLVVILAAVAVVGLIGGWPAALIFGVFVWGLVRRPRLQPRRVVEGPGYGYEFPWLDLPGMAYVGITERPPLPDGRLPRWDDEGHHAQRADVDLSQAVVYAFPSMVEADVWETARIAELALSGHTLLNIDKNPGRPAWERLEPDRRAA